MNLFFSRSNSLALTIWGAQGHLYVPTALIQDLSLRTVGALLHVLHELRFCAQLDSEDARAIVTSSTNAIDPWLQSVTNIQLSARAVCVREEDGGRKQGLLTAWKASG